LVRCTERTTIRTRQSVPVDGISPIHRDQDRVGIQGGEQKVRTAVFAYASKHGQRLPFQSVAGAGDRYRFWRGVMVGSLSRGRSTGFIINVCWPGSPIA
jgi:hypothetical protein